MFWQIPTIQAFHSVVPGSIMEFYDSIGVPRDVGSRPTTDHYAIRGLLSVHWLFDDDHDDSYFAGEDMSDPAMPGFAYYGNANGFDIWENQYYIPMGFSYDYYITRSEYNALNEGSENAIGDRELALMRAIVIEDDRVPYYEGILEHLPQSMRTFTRRLPPGLPGPPGTVLLLVPYTNTGFTALIDSTRDQVIFFSVPYEAGWSATVNGEPVAIEKVNVGFMAVVVPEGDSVTIEFTYRTPGLALGFGITLVSLALLVAYLMLMNRVRPVPPPSAVPACCGWGNSPSTPRAAMSPSGAPRPWSSTENGRPPCPRRRPPPPCRPRQRARPLPQREKPPPHE